MKCSYLCKECVDLNSCKTCDKNAGYDKEKGLCYCLEGYFNFNNQECKKCHYSCGVCVEEFKCKTC